MDNWLALWFVFLPEEGETTILVVVAFKTISSRVTLIESLKQQSTSQMCTTINRQTKLTTNHSGKFGSCDPLASEYGICTNNNAERCNNKRGIWRHGQQNRINELI
jgi:hypothetical protein